MTMKGNIYFFVASYGCDNNGIKNNNDNGMVE